MLSTTKLVLYNMEYSNYQLHGVGFGAGSIVRLER